MERGIHNPEVAGSIPAFAMKYMSNKILSLYANLLLKHGKPEGQWKLWCKRPKTNEEKETVIIEAILTQRTNWKNAELAMKNLHDSGIGGLDDIYKAGAAKIAPLIKPSGFYMQKSGYLFSLARFVIENYGTVKEMQKTLPGKLREELLGQKGVGPETADSILLYALGKPVFVIDEYTRRIAKEKGISDDRNYARLQKIFEAGVRKDYAIYQDFHALVVIEGKAKK